MLEEDVKLVKASFSSVMPYIAYPGELRELIEKEIEGCDCIETFLEKIKEGISGTNDITRKTDEQIFLNELRRRARKSNSD